MYDTAVYAGTFDPVTDGHIDLVERGAKMFSRLIVAVAANPGKDPLFSLRQRVAMVEEAVRDYDNIEVIGFSNLLVDFVKQSNAQVILRGLRAVSDFEYEFQLASMNRRLDESLETVFLTPAENHTFISASLVKEISKLGGDVSQFVPQHVFAALQDKFTAKK